MLAYRASESAFAQIQSPVNAYLEHWFGLVERGIPPEAIPSTDFAHRDRLNRAAIFDLKVDKVWAQVARLVGEETSEKMRHILIEQNF